MRSFITRNYVRSNSLMVTGIMLFLFVTLTVAPPQLNGCSGFPSPEMVIFLTDGNDDNPTYPAPAIGASPDAPERIYIIDEDTEQTFHVLWDTNGNTTVRVSDSSAYEISTFDIAPQCDWWPNDQPLVPLRDMQNFLTGGGQTAIPMLMDDDAGNAHPLESFLSESPAYFHMVDFASDNPLRQSVFALVPVDNNSNNPDWRRNCGGGRGYTNSVGPYPITAVGEEDIIKKVFESDGAETGISLLNCPAAFRQLITAGPDGQAETGDDRPRVLRSRNDSGYVEANILPFNFDPTNPYTASEDDDTPCWFDVPSSLLSGDFETWDGDTGGAARTSRTSDVQRMVPIGVRYKEELDPAWEFIGMGIELDIDSTNMVGSSNEQAYSNMNEGVIKCTFTVPTAPFFLQTEVKVVYLFYLKNATLEWYELRQTWDDSDREWKPQYLPTAGIDPTDLDTDDGDFTVLTGDDTLTGPFEIQVKGYMLRPSENPENQAKTFFGVRDNTPPAHVVVTNSDDDYDANLSAVTLSGSTGDTLSQNSNNPRFIDVTVIDNNPFAALYTDPESFGEVQAEGIMFPYSPAGDESPASSLELFYNTEVYDYKKATSTNADLDSDAQFSANLFKRRLIWAKGAFSDSYDVYKDHIQGGDTDTEGAQLVVAEIYDLNGNIITDTVIGRVNGANPQLINAPLEGESPLETAYSAVTYRIPIQSFTEPLPLHSTDGNGGLYGGRKLKWFTRVRDASGNVVPESSAGNLEQTLSSLTVQDATAGITEPDSEQIMGGSLPDYSAADDSEDGQNATNSMDDDEISIGSITRTNELIQSSSLNGMFSGTTPVAGTLTQMGIINVTEDDEPPQVFLYVTDIKYHKTYRFGLQKDGDGARSAMMGASDGWCTKSQELSLSNNMSGSNLNYNLRGYDLRAAMNAPGRHSSLSFTDIEDTDDFEPYGKGDGSAIVFEDSPFTDYDDYIQKAVEDGSFDPSAGYPAELPGCWVDEDTKLLFHIVAYDNCSTYQKNANSSSSNEMSIFDKKDPDNLGNGITNLTWTMKDNGQDVSNPEQYISDYTFRNPTVDDQFELIDEKECSVTVTVEDNEGNERSLTVKFFVMSNKMKFRSIEEKSGRGARNSWF